MHHWLTHQVRSRSRNVHDKKEALDQEVKKTEELVTRDLPCLSVKLAAMMAQSRVICCLTMPVMVNEGVSKGFI